MARTARKMRRRAVAWLGSKPEHNYNRKIRRLMDAGKMRPVTGLHKVDVNHDDGCAIFKGGACNCDPDIYLNGVLIK